MKKQVICIHGGDSYASYDEYLNFLKSHILTIEQLKKIGWKNKLQENLGDEYDVILPQMPCKWNAKYAEWKIWFDKIIPFLQDNVILVGHSMGSIFLVKYLSENKIDRKITATILVSAPFDEKDTDEKLMDFNLPDSIEGFKEQAGKIFLIQSEDDPVVPFVDLEKYGKVIPDAEKVIFKDRGHFSGEEFPEIIELIKNI
ncbi:MAG: alpha/beta hydrolase [Candidatus Moranbacteria bacterium]|nr:alpha/beta hydrolase [Candidatus Moranbacteria bacterium]